MGMSDENMSMLTQSAKLAWDFSAYAHEFELRSDFSALGHEFELRPGS